MPSSLSRNFLLGLGVSSLIFTVLAGVGAFAVFQRELADRQVRFLSQYVQARTDDVGHEFSNLMTLHRSAVTELSRRAALIPPAVADKALDDFYPLQADGTRRTAPALFDGVIRKSGAYVYGMGGFLADGAHMTSRDKSILVAAFPIVSGFGQAMQGDYDNFYFFTPQNRLVMFGPQRPDRLRFYRQTAPASLDFSHEEISRLVEPAHNPRGETRCTSLQKLLQDEKWAQRVATACVTPAYVGGRYVGAFGSSINLTKFLTSAVSEVLPGAATLIVRQDGSLIAFPGFAIPGVASERAVSAYEHRLGLRRLTRMAEAQHRASGVLVSPDGSHIVAYGRLSGPGWYLFLSYPAAAITWSAMRSASWVLLLALAGAALQTAVALRLARQSIIQPLQGLAASCRDRAGGGAAALGGRRDEIGVLARSLCDERARADEVLASLEQRVHERTAELERANAEKSRFLANMSHELRTPLNGVIAVSETLAREQVTPRNVELAELIVSSGRLLEKVLTDILDFSKIEAGEMRLEQRPFELAVTVARVAELHRASADAKGVAMSWRVDPAAEGTYLGDAVRLTQVLSNLLSNAVKFTEAGSIEALVNVTEDGRLRFCVADTGIGFDEAAKARLFHRFEQADVSIRRRFGGTGLGLAICQSLVELMGGEIQARSAPGEGATFSFVLPLARVATLATLAEAPPVQAVGGGMEALRVLLAEDHPTNQRVVQMILDAVGAELTIVDNGARALEAFDLARFDVVLMDMQMPELDGLSATALLREHEAARGAARTPVIMLTANALDEHVQASLAAGADRHLSKPLRPAELLDAIAAVVHPGDPSEDDEGLDRSAA